MQDYLQPRVISIIIVQTITVLDTQHIYALDASDNLTLGIIPLVIDYKTDHK